MEKKPEIPDMVSQEEALTIAMNAIKRTQIKMIKKKDKIHCPECDYEPTGFVLGAIGTLIVFTL